MTLFKSNPFPDLDTNRLRLRQPRSKDSNDYHRILSHPETSRYSDVPHEPSEKRSKQFINWMAKLHSTRTGIAWIVELKPTKEVIGAVRLYDIESKARCGKIAYEIDPEKWRSGLATEALAAVVQYAHNQLFLNRLEAWTSEDNAASERVLLKNGFELEGMQRDKAWFRDRHWNVRLYARLAGDKVHSRSEH